MKTFKYKRLWQGTDSEILTQIAKSCNNLEQQQTRNFKIQPKSQRWFERKRDLQYLARSALNNEISILTDGPSLLRKSLRSSSVSLRLKVMLLVRHDSSLFEDRTVASSLSSPFPALGLGQRKRGEQMMGRKEVENTTPTLWHYTPFSTD